MRRETRTLLVIGVVAVVAVTALALMADRYRRLVERAGGLPRAVSGRSDDRVPAVPPPAPGPVTEALAARWVDGFIDVRSEVRAEIESHADVVRAVLEDGSDRVRRDLPPGVIEAYRSVSESIRRRKREALARVGMSEGEYDRVRQAVTRPRDRAAASDPLSRAVDARRTEIEAVALGRFERFDLSLESF